MLHQIKICGITEKTSLDACIKLNVGFVGFNFVPASPRYIKPDDAMLLGQILPKHIAKVALVVDATDDIISHLIKTLKPDYLQLHGLESPQRVTHIKNNFKIPLIKAISVGNNQQDIVRAYDYYKDVDIILFDTKPSEKQTLTGGTGHQFDWSLLKEFDKRGKPFMLAGGLNYHNLLEAQTVTKADYYDICSGVEISRGIKSVQLIEELKNIFREL